MARGRPVVREWKGGNTAAFEGQQRQAVEEVSKQLYELTAAIKLLSENRIPAEGGTQLVVSQGDIYNQTVEDEGTPVTPRTTINFTGTGVTVADTGGKTTVAVSAGSGASTSDAFVTIGHPADLTAERNLAVGAALSLVDGGANGDVTLDRAALSGDVTASAGSNSTTIANDAVTYAKMQNVSAASRLLGRGSAGGAGDPEEIVLGTNLSMAGTTLNAAGGGGANVGTGTVNFGAFPGASDASQAITGQAGIVSGSILVVGLRLAATADHSADEHRVEEMDVTAGNIVAGTGFTVYAKTRNKRLYGSWTVQWLWA